MTQALPPLSKDRIDAFAASALAWALRLVRLIFMPSAERRSRAIHRFVQRLERHVENVIFLKAALRMGAPPPRAHWSGSLARGFRQRRGRMRHFFKSARIRARGATPIARVARLIAALADSEPYILHYMVRLARGLRLGGFVACAPPPILLGPDAPRACGFRDSS